MLCPWQFPAGTKVSEVFLTCVVVRKLDFLKGCFTVTWVRKEDSNSFQPPPKKNRLWMSRETVSIGSWLLFLLILFEAVGILQESTVSLTVWLIQFELNLGTGTWHWKKSAGEENTVFLALWHPQSLWKSSWKKGMHHKLYFPICFEAIKYPRKTRWWFQILFNVHPYLGKWSNLANI